MPTVLHDIAWRAMQVHGALGVTNEMPFLGMVTGAAVMGLADGPTEVHKTTVAKQVLRDYKASDDIWPTEWIPRKRDAARAKFAEYLETRGGRTCERPNSMSPACRLDGRRGAARQGRAADDALPVRRNPERDLRTAPRRRALRPAHATARRAPRPRQGHPARVAHHRGARRHRRAAHQGVGVCDGRHGARSAVLPDGLRRRLVADGHARQVARAVRQRPRRPAGAELPTGRGHRAAVQGRLAGQGAARPRPPGRLPRTPGRPVDRLPRTHQEARAARPRRGHRLAAGPPAARLHSRPHARRLPVRQRHVPARRPSATGGHRRLGDGHRRRPEARPGLDGAVLARTDTNDAERPR